MKAIGDIIIIKKNWVKFKNILMHCFKQYSTYLNNFIYIRSNVFNYLLFKTYYFVYSNKFLV